MLYSQTTAQLPSKCDRSRLLGSAAVDHVLKELKEQPRVKCEQKDLDFKRFVYI